MERAGRMETIEELCSFEGRLAGTDAERRAADRLAERLRATGRRAEVEPIHVHPQAPLVHAAHLLVGFAGSLISITAPVIGFALVLAAATSLYLDLGHRVYVLRSLFFRRASQNVVSPGSTPDAAARLVIGAHLDAGRGGAVYAPGRARRFARLAQRSRAPLGAWRVLFWSLASLLPLLGLRMAGVDSELISVIQLVPTLVLLIGVFALVEVELSDVVPGANRNASGVATALSLGEELERDPPANLDVWVVLDGGGECTEEGLRAFWRSRRKQLDRAATIAIVLDSVGGGDVRFETTGGWVVAYRMDRRMIELATAIAEADDRFAAAPLASGSGGGASAAARAGVRAIGISCRDRDGYIANDHLPTDTPGAVDADAVDRAHDFTLELIRRLDADLGRRALAVSETAA